MNGQQQHSMHPHRSLSFMLVKGKQLRANRLHYIPYPRRRRRRCRRRRRRRLLLRPSSSSSASSASSCGPNWPFQQQRKGEGGGGTRSRNSEIEEIVKQQLEKVE